MRILAETPSRWAKLFHVKHLGLRLELQTFYRLVRRQIYNEDGAR